jgi:hypothetical protein
MIKLLSKLRTRTTHRNTKKPQGIASTPVSLRSAVVNLLVSGSAVGRVSAGTVTASTVFGRWLLIQSIHTLHPQITSLYKLHDSTESYTSTADSALLPSAVHCTTSLNVSLRCIMSLLHITLYIVQNFVHCTKNKMELDTSAVSGGSQ